MLRSIGKISKSFFVKVLVAIIILPFVFWGMGDVFSGGNQNIIATIGSDKLGTKEFINYLNRINLNENERKNLAKSNTIEKILAEYIGRKIIQLEIENLGIQITDSSLKNIIINDKTFFKDGKFSRTKYEKFLIQSGISAPIFEKNIIEQEKKRQLLSFLSEGVNVPHFLIQSEYNKENQIKNIQYINLKNFYNNQEIKKEDINNMFKKNKKVFIEIFKSFDFIELKPFLLIGENDYNKNYFSIIDKIENNILDGQNISEISKALNLTLSNFQAVNYKRINTSGSKVKEDLNEKLFNRIFSINKENTPELFKIENKYYLAEISKIDARNKDITNKEVLDSITSQIKIKNKIEYNTQIVKNIAQGKLVANQIQNYAIDNKLIVKKLTIKDLQDNTIFSSNLIKRIFESNDGELNLITNSRLSENFIIHTLSTEYIALEKNDKLYDEYKAKAKLNFSQEIFNVYDSNVNSRYNVKLNNKTIDRIKNSF